MKCPECGEDTEKVAYCTGWFCHVCHEYADECGGCDAMLCSCDMAAHECLEHSDSEQQA